MEKVNAQSTMVVLIPCYNDWEALSILLRQLDASLTPTAWRATVVLVDDCSSLRRAEDLAQGPFCAISKVEVVQMRRNMGHQRAISIGLNHAFENHSADAVLVMDADGEDRPDDVPRLLDAFDKHQRAVIVFAERSRRSEDLTFRTGYFLYRILHRILTGVPVKVGNFSVVPWKCLSSLVVIPETWNHYAASVFRSRMMYVGLPTARGKRLAGKSKLNPVNLVVHGLSAIAIFSDVVGVRLSLAALAGAGFFSALCLGAIIIKYTTSLAIPGWATTAVGLLLIILMQMTVLILGFTGLVMFNRNNLGFIPIRDYKYFVGQIIEIYKSI